MPDKKAARARLAQEIQGFHPRLWRYCLALSGERTAAEDLCQSACLRALEKSDQLQPASNSDRWVFRIARNLWFNQLRAEKVRRGGGLVASDDIALASPDPNAETNIFHAEVLRAVMALPEAQRITVFLVYVEGFSYKEAAEHLQIPIGTVMSRLAAARSKLAAYNPNADAATRQSL
ncbi:RNA polymerase sigma factor [Pelagibius litoralis]|uniref:RNA polymerase sigma factor n=1 Tax=Pelagibius litoralis TaxID=374515 RepID=A0A967C3B7_9PROT|nr:RNA polymerase sigma factor [Pelagibius litoralis]NIA67705.1 RNA polymerase sigma factor [Pelagibius litoralis]